MTHSFTRRTICAGMATLGVGMFGETARAQPQDMRGGVTFAGGQVIPAGRIEIFVEDTASQNEEQPGDQSISIESDGKSYQIDFPFPWPTITSQSPTLRLVALLERTDGWLLARGSAKIKPGRPISITLNTVMY